MQLQADGCQYVIGDAALMICQNDVQLMSLPLLPAAGSQRFEPGHWREVDAHHVRMEVAGLGSVHLAVRESHVCYWIETERRHFPSLTYFPDSQPIRTRWHTFLSDELDGTWSADENVNVPLSSSYFTEHPDGGDGSGMTDPGDQPITWIWNVPPRAFAVETGTGWMGFSMPGPLSVGVTRLHHRRGLFNLTFEQLRPTAKEWGPPRVYFVPGLADPYDILDEHRRISDRCGLTVKHDPAHPRWWSYPSFKAGDEVWRLNGYKWFLADERAKNYTSYLTTENWLGWIDHVSRYAGLDRGMNLQVDQLYFRGYGSKTTISTLGGNDGFRKTIDQLRQQNMRLGLYVHPYLVNPEVVDFSAKHPEAICKPKDPSRIHSRGDEAAVSNLAFIDWTHPLGRQFILDLVEWIVSEKAGCLNADILLVNNSMCVDPRYFDFHDPDWGTGDLMQMKATRAIYEHAKKIKPDVMVRRQSPGDLYMQPYCDMANLCEEWNGQTHAWYDRMRIATRVLQDCILHMDAWWVTLTKLTEYYFALCVLYPPEIESVRHAIHPYVHHRSMRQKDYRRIHGGVQTYMNAPCRRSDQCRLDFDREGRPQIWRKRTDGPLAGWFAAVAMGRRAFVTYSEAEARICASRERRVTVPLPHVSAASANLKHVQAVTHAREHVAYEYEVVQMDGHPAVRLWAPDSGEDVMYISVAYELS